MPSRRRTSLHFNKAEFAIPDVHGDPDALRVMLRKVPSGSRVVFLGDIVNKGGDSLGALSLLREESTRYKAQYLWGNHDLLFIRALRGSFDAQAKLFSQRDGTQIFSELKEIKLKKDADRCFSRYANVQPNFRVSAKDVRGSNATFIKEINCLFKSHQTINDHIEWMIQNFQLFFLSPARNLYIHAGIPVLKNGRPILPLPKLKALEKKLAVTLSRENYDDPLFTLLDIPERSPIRLRHWVNAISDPIEFCKKLGVRAIIGGHAEIRVDDIKNERFPIIRHDFGASRAMRGIPSVLEYRGGNSYFSYIRQSDKWRTIQR